MATSSSGRPIQGEVVIEFNDGETYIQHKLEAAVIEVDKRRIQREQATKAQEAMEALDVAKSGQAPHEADVIFVVEQMDCKRDAAVAALKAEGGDVRKALTRMIRQ